MWEIFGAEPFVLAPKHAAVFRAAAASLSDFVGWEACSDDYCDMGVAVFDKLSQGQKQLAILTVAKALLDPNVEPPTISAVLAGTIHAIYCQLECLIEIDAFRGRESGVRQLLFEAIAEKDEAKEAEGVLDADTEPTTPLSAESDDLERWNDLVESLRSNVLEDYDFAIDSNIANMSPQQAAALTKLMNIDPNYFVAVVEDPVPEQLKQIQSEIQKLLN